MLTRTMLQRVLGAFWLIDGLLQLKPKMFTSAFLSQVVEPTSKAEPAMIAQLVNFGIHLADKNIVFWDAMFALIQILLGLALMFHVRPRLSLTASIIWSALVWVFGEGMGQMFTGQALVLTGAPGAVLLYGLVAVAVWPGKRQSAPSDWSFFQIHFARASLGLIWLFGCILHFQHVYAAGTGIASLITVSWLAQFVSIHPAVTGLLFTIVEFSVGSMLLLNIYKLFTVWTSIFVSLLFWWIGQSFGQVFTPLATDVNSGPLLILLALTASPWLFSRSREQGSKKGNLKLCRERDSVYWNSIVHH